MNLTRKETVDNFVTEKIDVYKNNLLGDYDDNGVYFVSPQIVDELIKLPKEQTTSFDNSYFCVGELLGYGEITFQLSFGKNLNDREHANATLYLLEAVDKINGYVQNTIKTKLAVFENSVSNFMEKTFSFFSIKAKKSDKDGGMNKKIVDEESISQSYILAKKQYSLFLSKLSDEKCLDAYGKYFTSRYTVLTRMNNPFSNAVLELFNEEYARIEKYFLKEKNYKILNELLDKCIEEISGTSENYSTAEKEFQEKTASALEVFTENVGKIHEKMGSKALNMLSKDDKQKMEVIKDSEEKRNRENDAPDFSDEAPIYGIDDEVSASKPAKTVSSKEPKSKDASEKLNKAFEKVKSIRQNERVEKTPKTEEKEQNKKTETTVVEEKKEEKQDRKKTYSELFSYLNEQRKKTQTSVANKEKEDDGMSM